MEISSDGGERSEVRPAAVPVAAASGVQGILAAAGGGPSREPQRAEGGLVRRGSRRSLAGGAFPSTPPCDELPSHWPRRSRSLLAAHRRHRAGDRESRGSPGGTQLRPPFNRVCLHSRPLARPAPMSPLQTSTRRMPLAIVAAAVFMRILRLWHAVECAVPVCLQCPQRRFPVGSISLWR